VSYRVGLSGIGAAAAMAQKAELAFASGGYLNHGIEEILQRAATEERDTHAYRNQTGHAQQGTKASVVSESDSDFTAHLEMGEEYSSYLVERGFSRFTEIAAKATREVKRHVKSVDKLVLK
jgi:predicted flap endonuclease-1-like 5' DNA nuclease